MDAEQSEAVLNVLENRNAQCTRVYLAMAVLSTLVAAFGLHYDSVAIIIGAMVMAPLLGPSVALALGTALGTCRFFFDARS